LKTANYLTYSTCNIIIARCDECICTRINKLAQSNLETGRVATHSQRCKLKTFSRRRPNGKFDSVNREQKPPKLLLPLARRRPPSNTTMPQPTPRNTPNYSSDGSRTFVQLCCKLPIGYNGVPHIRPPRLPPPVDQFPNPTTCLIPGTIQPTIPNRIHIQLAVLPQCTGQTDRQTNKWLEEIFDDYRPLSLYRERRRRLIILSDQEWS